MEPLGRSTSDSPSQLKSPIHMRNSQGNHNSASAPSPNLNFANEDRPNTSQCIYVLHDQPNESSNTLASSGSQLFTQCLATNVVEPSSEPILHPMDFYSTAPLFHQNLKLAPTQSGIFSQNNLDALHSLFEMKKEPKNIGDRSSILLGSLDPILTPIDDDSLGSTSRQYRDLAFVESSLTTMENSPFSELEDESTRKYREKRERNNLAARKHRKNRTQREHEKSLRAEALVAECRELREILNTNLEYIKNLEREVQAHKQRLDNKENTVGCVNAEYPATMRASSPQIFGRISQKFSGKSPDRLKEAKSNLKKDNERQKQIEDEKMRIREKYDYFKQKQNLQQQARLRVSQFDPCQVAASCSEYIRDDLNQANTISWGPTYDGFTSDTIPMCYGNNKLVIVLQARYCMVIGRKSPLLVIASLSGVMIYDPYLSSAIFWHLISESRFGVSHFARGIISKENFIFVGTHTGDILIFEYLPDNSILLQEPKQHHRFAIVDISKCDSKDMICSCDVSGLVVVWADGMRTIKSSIQTQCNANCLGLLKSFVLIGTISGEVLIYSITTTELLVKMNAHYRHVNAIAVASNGNFFLTVSEDGHVHVWQIGVGTSEYLRVTWKYSEIVENSALVGAVFLDNNGESFIVSSFDSTKLLRFEMV